MTDITLLHKLQILPTQQYAFIVCVKKLPSGGGEGGGVVMVDIRSGLLPVLALLSLSVLSPPSPLSPLSLPEPLLFPAAHNPLQRAKGSYHEAKSTLCAGSCTGSGQIYGLYQRFFPARPLE